MTFCGFGGVFLVLVASAEEMAKAAANAEKDNPRAPRRVVAPRRGRSRKVRTCDPPLLVLLFEMIIAAPFEVNLYGDRQAESRIQIV